ncbi:sugar nucleotide-binding protein [Planctobacterium marinum]|uniref:sugar nucleotide-binding protein n=1 Tax=Planctobacterium marinum TaxID=1631968 RepID=UPI001E3580EC|nr:sugar nucleotide-binding protein [Planctobacterium marinum]MCC2606238.1 sugar nucleotide-binding protein [Planctobacterium marinum]
MTITPEIRILVIGSESKLARAFVTHCISHLNCAIHQTSRHNHRYHFLDLEEVENMSEFILQQEYDFCLVFAAMTNIAACHTDPVRAQLINCHAVQFLMGRLRVRHWVLFSTNQVFSGDEPYVNKDAIFSPFSEYGKSKVLMELVAKEHSHSVAIVRLTKVIDGQYPLFRKFITSLLNGEKVAVYKDMVFAPVYIERVCQFLVALVANFKPGVYQLSASNDISYYSALRFIGKLLQLPEENVIAQLALQQCPKNTTLKVDKQENRLGFTSESAEQALKEAFVLNWHLTH